MWVSWITYRCLAWTVSCRRGWITATTFRPINRSGQPRIPPDITGLSATVEHFSEHTCQRVALSIEFFEEASQCRSRRPLRQSSLTLPCGRYWSAPRAHEVIYRRSGDGIDALGTTKTVSWRLLYAMQMIALG